MKKETVGKVATDLLSKDVGKISVMEQQEASLQDYMKNLLDCVDDGYKKYEGDFFVVVILKKEKLLKNVLRNYFLHRVTCPTPDYDQSVFRYNRVAGQIEYIWTIPDKDTCLYLLENMSQLPNDEKQLLSFVIMFKNGKLGEMCKKLNKETGAEPDIVLYKKGEEDVIRDEISKAS